MQVNIVLDQLSCYMNYILCYFSWKTSILASGVIALKSPFNTRQLGTNTLGSNNSPPDSQQLPVARQSYRNVKYSSQTPSANYNSRHDNLPYSGRAELSAASDAYSILRT